MKNTIISRKGVGFIFSNYTKTLIAVVSLLVLTSCEKEEEISPTEESNAIEITSKNNYRQRGAIEHLDKAFANIKRIETAANNIYNSLNNVIIGNTGGCNICDPEDSDNDTDNDDTENKSTKSSTISFAQRVTIITNLKTEVYSLRNTDIINTTVYFEDALKALGDNPIQLAYRPENQVINSINTLADQSRATKDVLKIIDSFLDLSVTTQEFMSTTYYIDNYIKPIYYFYGALLNRASSSYLDSDKSIEDLIDLQYKIRPRSLSFYMLTRSGLRTRKMGSNFYINIRNSIYGRSDLMMPNGYINSTKIHTVSLNSSGKLSNGNTKHLYTVDLLFPGQTKLNIKQQQNGRAINITNNHIGFINGSEFNVQINDNIIRN